jgi:ankyrin repeat protein
VEFYWGYEVVMKIIKYKNDFQWILITCFLFIVSLPCFSQKGELAEACQRGDVERVMALVNQGVDLNMKSYYGMTPLMIAAESGEDEICGILIDAKANLEICDNDGNTALLHACMRCQHAIATLLMKTGAKFVLNNYGISALDYAICCTLSNQELASRLISHYELKTRMPTMISKALCYATTIQEAQFLISNGADINFHDQEGRNPLLSAITPEKSEVAEYLIEHGADINFREMKGDGWTPLLAAVNEGLTPLVELLISKGANWKPRIKKGVFTDLNALGMAIILAKKQNDKFLAKLPPMARVQYTGDEFKQRQSEIESLLRKYGAKP